MPTILTKIKNFSKAVVLYLLSGCKTTTPAQYTNRLDICNSCEHNIKGTCDECGCILKLKAKWTTQDCPLDKWNTLE